MSNAIPVEIVKSCEGVECISISDLFTFMGALLGTLLAGLFTLKSVKKQIKHSNEIEEMRELKNFSKVFTDLKPKIDDIERIFGRSIEKFRETEEQAERNDIVKKLRDDFSSIKADINNIDYVEIAPKLYIRIQGIVTVVDSVIREVNIYEENKLDYEDLDRLVNYYNSFERFYEGLKEYDSDALKKI